jgi:hypothetical protein
MNRRKLHKCVPNSGTGTPKNIKAPHQGYLMFPFSAFPSKTSMRPTDLSSAHTHTHTHLYDVAYLLRAGIEEQEKMSVARQRLCKHATIREHSLGN